MRTLAAAVWLCPGGRTARFAYTSADRCLSLQLAAAFVVQPPAKGPPMTMTTIAIRHQPGGTITLGVRCTPGGIRVDVHGSVDVHGAIGPDLILVRTLSDEWGCYPTPAGQAIYFTLAGQR